MLVGEPMDFSEQLSILRQENRTPVGTKMTEMLSRALVLRNINIDINQVIINLHNS